MDKIIQDFCKDRGFKLAKQIDDSIFVLIKPKPKYCPKWLYKKIIKDSLLIVEKK